MKEIENIQDIHSILLDSLCYFDSFCKSKGLKYFLGNGTLLGAAKYGGFVPWDDDADILMPREDYDKLVNLTFNTPSLGGLLSIAPNEATAEMVEMIYKDSMKPLSK